MFLQKSEPTNQESEVLELSLYYTDHDYTPLLLKRWMLYAPY